MQRAGISFVVDDVEPASAACALEPVRGTLSKVAEELRAMSQRDLCVVAGLQGNPLVSAVRLAFSQHYPLYLSPDAIWLTIAQGFAQHINLHAEELRPRFVRHQGKRELIVQRLDELAEHEWPAVVEEFCGQIRDNVGPGLHDLMVCDFTTTGDIERVGSYVAMMDAFQAYFDYSVDIICGIPRIVLGGTPEDWRKILDRARVIAEYDLAWWTERLVPICEELVRTAEGAPNRDFWQCIYSPTEVYGGDEIRGWIAQLFPYLRDKGKKNLVVVAPELPSVGLWRSREWQASKRRQWITGGVSPDQLPLGLSRAPVRIKRADGRVECVAVFGGLVGVTQDPRTLAVEPAPGWFVSRDAMETIVHEIKGSHEAHPPLAAHIIAKLSDTGMPAELRKLHEHFDGARLFDGAVVLRPMDAFAKVEVEGRQWREPTNFCDVLDQWNNAATRFCDFSDGTGVAFVRAPRSSGVIEWWFVPVRPDEEVIPANAPVIAKGLVELLERLVAAKGTRYFDAPEFVPVVLLSHE